VLANTMATTSLLLQVCFQVFSHKTQHRRRLMSETSPLIRCSRGRTLLSSVQVTDSSSFASLWIRGRQQGSSSSSCTYSYFKRRRRGSGRVSVDSSSRSKPAGDTRRIGENNGEYSRATESTVTSAVGAKTVGPPSNEDGATIPVPPLPPPPASVVEEEEVQSKPFLANWKPPRYLWRALAAFIIAGQVIIRSIRGRVHVRNTLQQLELVGPRSLGVSLLTASFVGMVFTIQAGTIPTSLLWLLCSLLCCSRLMIIVDKSLQ
jgi:hypothetical protein